MRLIIVSLLLDELILAARGGGEECGRDLN
jgi:hypothetical protein